MDAQSAAMQRNAAEFDVFCKAVEKRKGRVRVGIVEGDATPSNPSKLLIKVRNKDGEVVASELVTGSMVQAIGALRARVKL